MIYPKLWDKYSVTSACKKLGQLDWTFVDTKFAIEQLLIEQKGLPKNFAIEDRTISTGLSDGKNKKYAKNTAQFSSEELVKITSYLSLSNTVAPFLSEFLVGNDETIERLKKNIGDKIPQGQISAKITSITSNVRIRDLQVVAYVLKESKGNCECCRNTAPFIKETGEPYLEVHHVVKLADNGRDTIDNAVAVCPNCHRELHSGVNSRKLIEKLYSNISRLRR